MDYSPQLKSLKTLPCQQFFQPVQNTSGIILPDINHNIVASVQNISSPLSLSIGSRYSPEVSTILITGTFSDVPSPAASAPKSAYAMDWDWHILLDLEDHTSQLGYLQLSGHHVSIYSVQHVNKLTNEYSVTYPMLEQGTSCNATKEISANHSDFVIAPSEIPKANTTFLSKIYPIYYCEPSYPLAKVSRLKSSLAVVLTDISESSTVIISENRAEKPPFSDLKDINQFYYRVVNVSLKSLCKTDVQDANTVSVLPELLKCISETKDISTFSLATGVYKHFDKTIIRSIVCKTDMGCTIFKCLAVRTTSLLDQMSTSIVGVTVWTTDFLVQSYCLGVKLCSSKFLSEISIQSFSTTSITFGIIKQGNRIIIAEDICTKYLVVAKTNFHNLTSLECVCNVNVLATVDSGMMEAIDSKGVQADITITSYATKLILLADVESSDLINMVLQVFIAPNLMQPANINAVITSTFHSLNQPGIQVTMTSALAPETSTVAIGAKTPKLCDQAVIAVVDKVEMAPKISQRMSFRTVLMTFTNGFWNFFVAKIGTGASITQQPHEKQKVMPFLAYCQSHLSGLEALPCQQDLVFPMCPLSNPKIFMLKFDHQFFQPVKNTSVTIVLTVEINYRVIPPFHFNSLPNSLSSASSFYDSPLKCTEVIANTSLTPLGFDNIIGKSACIKNCHVLLNVGDHKYQLGYLQLSCHVRIYCVSTVNYTTELTSKYSITYFMLEQATSCNAMKVISTKHNDFYIAPTKTPKTSTTNLSKINPVDQSCPLPKLPRIMILYSSLAKVLPNISGYSTASETEVEKSPETVIHQQNDLFPSYAASCFSLESDLKPLPCHQDAHIQLIISFSKFKLDDNRFWKGATINQPRTSRKDTSLILSMQVWCLKYCDPVNSTLAKGYSCNSLNVELKQQLATNQLSLSKFLNDGVHNMMQMTFSNSKYFNLAMNASLFEPLCKTDVQGDATINILPETLKCISETNFDDFSTFSLATGAYERLDQIIVQGILFKTVIGCTMFKCLAVRTTSLFGQMSTGIVGVMFWSTDFLDQSYILAMEICCLKLLNEISMQTFSIASITLGTNKHFNRIIAEDISTGYLAVAKTNFSHNMKMLATDDWGGIQTIGSAGMEGKFNIAYDATKLFRLTDVGISDTINMVPQVFTALGLMKPTINDVIASAFQSLDQEGAMITLAVAPETPKSLAQCGSWILDTMSAIKLLDQTKASTVTLGAETPKLLVQTVVGTVGMTPMIFTIIDPTSGSIIKNTHVKADMSKPFVNGIIRMIGTVSVVPEIIEGERGISAIVPESSKPPPSIYTIIDVTIDGVGIMAAAVEASKTFNQAGIRVSNTVDITPRTFNTIDYDTMYRHYGCRN